MSIPSGDFVGGIIPHRGPTQCNDLTLNYLRVPFPHKRLIRTTNLLERFFREFRSRADEIGCFGSQAQAETLFYLVLRREKAKHAIA